AAPLLGKIRGSRVTLRHLIRQSPIAPGAFEGQFRRMLSPFGIIGRRQNRPAMLKQSPSLLGRMNAGTLSPAPELKTPASLATPANTLQATLPWWATPTLIPYLQRLPLWLLILGLLLLLLAAVTFLLGAGVTVAAVLAALLFADVQGKILQQTQPQVTFAQRYAACVQTAQGLGGRKSYDPLAPPMPYPKFLNPMYKYLLDMGPEWIMPGLASIPQNSVTLLKNNQKVIEAYLHG